MDKIKKFLARLSKSQRKALLKILADIQELNLSNYDIKPLKGYKNVFRLRKGKIRIVFAKQKNRGLILDVAHRKNIYKKSHH